MKKIIHAIFEAGAHPHLDEFERRSIRLLNRLIFVAFVGTVGFAIIDLFNANYEVAALPLVVGSVFWLEQTFAKRGKYNAAKYLVFGFILCWGVLFSVIVGNIANAQYMLLPVAMFPLLFFRSIKMGIVMFALIVGAFILTIYLQEIVEPIIILADHLAFAYTILAAFMMMMIIFLLTLYSRSLTNEFERIIVQKNNELTGAYKDIKDSITYAKRLQEAILPSAQFIQAYLPHSFILYEPKDIVAGDFYWFHVDERTHELYIAAADCTGHGVPGAMVSVVCSNALNRAVIELGISEPGKILDKVRELVIETFEKSGSEVKDGMDISLMSINPGKQKQIKWAGANNPLWYISNNEFREITANKQPIGKFDNSKPFTTHQLELKENDMVFLLTDGYADQFGGPKGKKFKYKQMIELLKKNSSFKLDVQLELLHKAFSEWRGNNEQVDDVCVIGIKL
jgi:serine phosphatase RsbU (regulator of sigma subunit)